MSIFKHQDTVIQTDHIVALRTEHPLAGREPAQYVVALYTAYGKPLQLTMTAAERDALVQAMESVAVMSVEHDYKITPINVTPEAAAEIAYQLSRSARADGRIAG